MILYHGSNMEVSCIDLGKCGKYKDFGQGFYLTSLKEQAIEWAKKVKIRHNSGVATLNIYNFDEKTDDLNMIQFLSPDEKWATFVINNRNRNFNNHFDILSNQDNKYDFVHGLVANDDISAILETFLLGILPMEQLPNALIYKKLNDQYSFHSSKGISKLKFLSSETI